MWRPLPASGGRASSASAPSWVERLLPDPNLAELWPRRAEMNESSTDLLVVGGGMAGLSAGAWAAQHGARVTLVEKAAQVGGSAAFAGFVWTAASYAALREALEVERVLVTHPAICDVGVVGVPDERLGERAAAVVVPHPGPSPDLAGLSAYLAEREVPLQSRPELLFRWTRCP